MGLMARLLPSTPDLSAADNARPRVIGLDDDDADDLLAAMSSDTARHLLAELHDEPAAPSELTGAVDTSLQNVQYHLGKLEDAGVVEVIDTVYSEKGREMKVYAPADKPLVVVAGGEEEAAGLRTALTSLIGGLGILAVISVVIQFVFGDGLTSFGGADGGGSVSIMQTSSQAQSAGGPVMELLTTPGVLFFAGGTAVLVIGLAVWYARR